MTKASVFDTAKYILEQTGSMSAMKLQKLCYYAQAWSLVWDDEPLFPEDFQAWANGPVCEELYSATKGKFTLESSEEAGNSENLTEAQKDNIRRVLMYYGKHNAQWLSQLTHMEAPYKLAHEGIPEGVSTSNIITKASMAEYYGSL